VSECAIARGVFLILFCVRPAGRTQNKIKKTPPSHAHTHKQLHFVWGFSCKKNPTQNACGRMPTTATTTKKIKGMRPLFLFGFVPPAGGTKPKRKKQ
jgi:hypothetical protein